MKLYAYNAGKGDCVRVEVGSHNIFIDTGVTRFGNDFRSICEKIITSGGCLDLLILTHVDDDHIGGILHLLRLGWKCPFKEVRMNSDAQTSVNSLLSTVQNNEVYKRLTDQGVTILPMMVGDEIILDEARIRTLWPKELYGQGRTNAPLAYKRDNGMLLSDLASMPINHSDTSINNRNSIVFTLSCNDRNLLFTGDAWGIDIIDALEASDILEFDLVKLPHHGAVGNLTDKFPEYIRSTNFLICTDGRMHPDKQTIAKLMSWYGNVTIYSPSDWWSKGFFIEKDNRLGVNMIQKEGQFLEL